MIYGALSRILFPVTAVALVGAGMWGYQEHNEKNSVLIKAENQYQRAFHDLTNTVDQLNEELGKSLVINSRKQVTPCLTNVWRLAYQAQSDVGQLPLTLMPFNHTEEFLAKVADFSYGVAVRDLAAKPLTQAEYNTLKRLYEHSKSIQKELDQVQSKVIDNHLRWMDVESALASADKKSDNTIIDGFRTIDKRVQEFPEVDWGVTIQSLDEKKKQRIKGLTGEKISREQALAAARRFLGLRATENGVRMEVDDNGKGEDYTAYSVNVTRPNRAPIQLDVTKRGGKVIWLLDERDIQRPRLSLAEAEKQGGRFLRSRGYGNMVATEVDSYQGMGVFTFVPQQNGVRLYPDAILVKVALDNGEVVGFQAKEYLFNHKPRTIPAAKITAEQARKMVNPQVKTSSPRLVLIEGKRDGKEALCYEFIGTYDQRTYAIYINALTGDEEEIVKMDVGTAGETM